MPFPEHCFPNTSDQNARLSHLNCNGAMAAMHCLFTESLKSEIPTDFHSDCAVDVDRALDIYAKIDEVIVNLKLKITRAYAPNVFDATTYIHNVLRVTMKNGEVFALDITGSQFGWCDSILSWPSFFDSRVRTIKEIRAFGTTARTVKEEAHAAGDLASASNN